MAHRAKKHTQRSRPTGGTVAGAMSRSRAVSAAAPLGGATVRPASPGASQPRGATEPLAARRVDGAVAAKPSAPAPTTAAKSASGAAATMTGAPRTLAANVGAPIDAASANEREHTDTRDAAPAKPIASAADAPDAADAPTAPPTGAPPKGASLMFWNSWSNRRLFSVGAVAIGVAIVLSLLLHGLLTPAATTTANYHAKPLPPDPLINHYAPGTTMVDLSGNPVALASLKGKVVVLNFWYAACDPCRYEMPALEKAYQAYRAQGVVVVGIDPVDTAQTATSYTHSLGVTYPITLDKNLATVQTYKVFDTPTTFFIDRQGVIRYKSVGSLTSATLNTDITALLKA